MYAVWQILFTWLSIFMVLSKITPRLRTVMFGCMRSPFKLIIMSSVRALAKYREDRIIISVFFCIEFEKVGLHPNLNFRYTFLYWAKAGIIILTKWNIELRIIYITVELHTKFSQNVTERKKICGKQHWAQYWALWYTTFQLVLLDCTFLIATCWVRYFK